MIALQIFIYWLFAGAIFTTVLLAVTTYVRESSR